MFAKLQAKCIEMMLKLIVSNCQKGIWMILVERGSCFFSVLGVSPFSPQVREDIDQAFSG